LIIQILVKEVNRIRVRQVSISSGSDEGYIGNPY
jgi:hypothetical protein